MATHSDLPATLEQLANTPQINCQGAWTLSGITKLNIDTNSQKIISDTKSQIITIDGSAITHMDSSGAWELHQLLDNLKQQNITVTLQGFSKEQQSLLALITEQAKNLTVPRPIKALPWLARLGKQTITQLQEARNFLAFIGESALIAIRIFKKPTRLRWSAIFGTIETMGYQALPIIALLSFMIGVVLTYQMGLQLRNYGANIFIVDFLGISVLREFAPLLTAIMVAGRTGSAFTASLGTMKLNEEIDALNTMGVSPTELLILPRLFGLIIALPLLTIWADIFGILGGLVMAKSMLGVEPYNFLQRFSSVIPTRSLIIGISKAPVFALIIASIGCFQGMQVLNSADSVGRQTTKSVVQAIFFIIVADAIFSVLFSHFKI